ncbi:sulfurtransferase [Spiribacter vilamensis]|uniref:Thiosulfate/3-mercaptopyruvate sulfurtransferase n=2 Tax=Spiribacter vilamensis TaxID=531306 RepID=A0A4Q8CZ84_9GAMM|nr:sulfurtransferase [Spiribacter vilamensis]RZU98319.1 thiosulfate/3-mercaptopyruvate sulfurtransferase [Spiribacter vilamensis]TVO60792.1 sulfurtransferase [Spiribacter vilamensis]
MHKQLSSLGVGLLTLLGSASALAATPPLVGPDWLSDRVENSDIAVLDVRSAIDDGDKIAFADGHIPGAVDAGYTSHPWRATQDDVVGKLPPVDELETLIGSLGVENGDTVVVVPAGTGPTDFGSAARIYWTFKTLGHDDVTILNGGYQGWVASGESVATGLVSPEQTSFSADLRQSMLVSTDAIENADTRGLQLVDARPSDYFKGETKHPEAAAAGTIPDAVNLEHQRFFSNDDVWRFDESSVSSIVDGITLDADRRPVSFCNTGHWASTTWFALSEIEGVDNVGLYDGSMVEWTANESRPVAVAKRGLARILEFFGG